MVRALGFAGVDQRDWHLDQILCPGNSLMTVPPHEDTGDTCAQSSSEISTHLAMVLVNFAFAPQKLGEDWSRPGYPVHNPLVGPNTIAQALSRAPSYRVPAANTDRWGALRSDHHQLFFHVNNFPSFPLSCLFFSSSTTVQ